MSTKKYPDDFINKIICGDCLEVMKEMPDRCIPITITSPPYNLGNIHHTGNKRFLPYPDNLPELEYQSQQLRFLQEMYRITAPYGSLFYFHKNRIKDGFQITPYQWILNSPWQVKQELVWFNRSQNFHKIRFYPMTERVYWLIKEPRTSFNNNINHHDLFSWKSEGTKKQFKRAFPERAVVDILLCFPNVELVFDPYLGSGTTVKVARDLHRNFIGIEINPEYCKIAEERLAQGVL